MARSGWLVAMVVLASAAAQAAGLCPYEPLVPGASRTYESTSTMMTDRSVTWDVRLVDSADLADGSQTVTLREMRTGGSQLWPPGRQTSLVRDPRGLFTPGAAAAGAEVTYGPAPLLLAAPELEQPDRVWTYQGQRHLPFALGVLMLLTRNPDPVATAGSYHVLSVGAVETPAATYPRAVQVSGVETVRVSFGDGGNEPLVMRARRWYVRGIGLVQEILQFPDVPNLGRIETVLTGVAGLKGEPPAA